MRKKLVSFTALILVGLLCVTTQPASAQNRSKRKQQAKELFGKGKVQFDLGRFARAIDHFSKGYEAYPDAAFLFSIAQSYRQLDDCKNSIFFFKRYLSATKSAPNRKAIQKRVQEIKANCDQKVSIRDKPPTGPVVKKPPPVVKKPPPVVKKPPPVVKKPPPVVKKPPPVVKKPPSTERITKTDDPPDNTTMQMPPDGQGTAGAVVDTISTEPSILALRAEIGAAIFGFGGDNNLGQTARVIVLVGAAYPLALGKNKLDLGVLVSLSSLSYQAANLSVVSNMVALLAGGSIRIPLSGSLMLRGELGIGAFIMSGLVTGNPFVVNGQAIDKGGVTMVHFRAAIGAEYALTSQLSLSVTPLALGFSPPDKSFRKDINSVTHLGISGGINFRF